jgi:CO/xanthine dehydrogenase Mo-binding subunit
MDAAHGCDLWIDVETGALKIERYVACHDVGHTLNPIAVTGQIVGGTVMGIGQALFERLDTVEGKVVNSSLREYLMPTSLDVPQIDVVVLETGTGFGPHGAKGLGESAAVAAPIAIANAIYDATGVPVGRLPVRPEDLFALARSGVRP